MKKKLKICVVLVNRANYGRSKSLMRNLKKNKKITLQIVATSSLLLNRFGNAVRYIEKDGFKIDEKIFTAIEGENNETMAKSVGIAIIELSQVFSRLKPDIVVTVADRYETIATAIAASYMNILIAHIQGGEITGSIDESVRHSVTKLSHIHLVCTKESRDRVIRMGENKNNVFNVGCPSIDYLKKNLLKKKIEINNYGTGDKIDLSKKFILVIFHPVTTNISDQNNQIQTLISSIERLDLQTIWLWPNIDAGSNIISKKLRLYQSKKKIKKLRFITSLEVEIYNNLLSKASCAIGNSSSFIREGSFLGTPAVIIGNRQNKREHGSNIKFVKIDRNQIINAVKKQINHGKYKKSKIYGSGNTSKKIERILLTNQPVIQKVFSD